MSYLCCNVSGACGSLTYIPSSTTQQMSRWLVNSNSLCGVEFSPNRYSITIQYGIEIIWEIWILSSYWISFNFCEDADPTSLWNCSGTRTWCDVSVLSGYWPHINVFWSTAPIPSNISSRTHEPRPMSIHKSLWSFVYVYHVWDVWYLLTLLYICHTIQYLPWLWYAITTTCITWVVIFVDPSLNIDCMHAYTGERAR